MSDKITLKNGQSIEINTFVEDVMQFVRRKNWDIVFNRLSDCIEIPHKSAGMIEIFLRSVRDSQMQIVDILLNLGIDINCCLNGHSAMSLCIELANSTMVCELIKRGVDVNLRPFYTTKTEQEEINPIAQTILEIAECQDRKDKEHLTDILNYLHKAGAAVIPKSKEWEKLRKASDDFTDKTINELLIKYTADAEENTANLPDNSNVSPSLQGQYQIDIDATIQFHIKKDKNSYSKTAPKKIVSLFRSRAEELKKIYFELTDKELVLHSPDGTERYTALSRKENRKQILEVEWGIPTFFYVKKIGNNLYHFECTGNILNEAIWKKGSISSTTFKFLTGEIKEKNLLSRCYTDNG